MTHLGLALSASAQHSGNDADMHEHAQAMLRGIRKYQTHPFQRPEPGRPVAWQAGEVKLLHFPAAGAKAHTAPVLIIPSMINKAYILDLLDGLSFCEWLAGQGLDVYLLDWGSSLDDPGQADMGRLFRERLIPALSFMGQDGPVHVLGYCMGGTLAAALAVLQPEHIRSLCLLAAPWDFQGEGGDLSKWVQFWMPAGLAFIVQQGHLPPDWIQTVFASLDPFHTAQKFTDFADMAENDPKADIFVAVEDWLNDALALPGSLARTCLEDWFMHNHPANGAWAVDGTAIVPEEVQSPVLIVASEQDRLVPYASSICFTPGGERSILTAQCGHIGFMASQRSIEQVWQPIAAFFQKNA